MRDDQLIGDLSAYYLRRLNYLLAGSTEVGESGELPAIRFCHYLLSGESDAWGGLVELLFDLVAQGDEEKLPATLVFGFLPKEVALQRESVAKIFEWPGVQYLSYTVSDDVLLDAAHAAIEGAKQPLPNWREREGRRNLLDMSSKVRHWLENRRTNVTGMLDNFRGALRGEPLSPFHLNSQPTISKDHKEMVNRLWAYESLAAKLAPSSGGIVPLRAAMDEFEQAWSAFDAARESYRLELESGAAGKDQIKSVISQLEKVVAAVRKTIEATYTLDAALKKKR